MGFERFDVVVAPVPFSDSATARRRPALVMSNAETFNTPSDHSVMAMITSAGNAAWPLDVTISDGDMDGLTAASLVRMKLFMLDKRFILRKLAQLAPIDRRTVATALKHWQGGASFRDYLSPKSKNPPP